MVLGLGAFALMDYSSSYIDCIFADSDWRKDKKGKVVNPGM